MTQFISVHITRINQDNESKLFNALQNNGYSGGFERLNLASGIIREIDNDDHGAALLFDLINLGFTLTRLS